MMLLPLLLSLIPDGSRAQDWLYKVQVPSPVKVQEGLCVFLPCSIEYPKDGWMDTTPAYGYWFTRPTDTLRGAPVATNHPDREVQESARGRFLLVGDPSKYNCSLLLREARREDAGLYVFRLERGEKVKYNFKQWLMLEVTALTQKPDIFIPEALEPGRPVKALCVFNLTSELCPAPTFSWTGAAVTTQGTQLRSTHYSVLSFTPRLQDQDQDTELTCRVDFSLPARSTQETVHLHFAAPSPTTAALKPQEGTTHLETQRGQYLRLVCTAASQCPATLTWLLWDRVLTRSLPSSPTSLVLELPVLKPEDSGQYTCRAENRWGSSQRSLDLVVNYPPEKLTAMLAQGNSTVMDNLRNGSVLPVLQGRPLRLACVARSSPPAVLSWTWSTQAQSIPPPSEPGVLELPQVQPEHEGEFSCLAWNKLGAQRLSLYLAVHYPPRLPGPFCSWEAWGLHCHCSSQAQPAPSLRWRLEERLLEGNSSGNGSVASLTVTSSSAGPWANSSLSLRRDFRPGLRLSCEVWNVHGGRSAQVLLLRLPDEGGFAPTVFSKGVCLGIGVTTLLFLCLILIIVKTLRRKPTLAEGSRAKLTRRSTFLEYINVVPKAQNQKGRPSRPSQDPAPGTAALSQEHKKNPKGLHEGRPGRPSQDPASGTAALSQEHKKNPKGLHVVSESCQEELHYAALNFPILRPRDSPKSEDAHVDYAEVKFH